jgi:hypothetical protein
MSYVSSVSGAELRPSSNAPLAHPQRLSWSTPRFVRVPVSESEAASCEGSDGNIGS